MTAVVVNVLLVVGTGFMVLGAVGALRLPDLYMRMHAATKAPSLGAGLLLIAAAVHFADMTVTTRAAFTILFIFLTVPVAAHTLGRAAYLKRVERWQGMVVDELEGRHDPRTREPSAGDER